MRKDSVIKSNVDCAVLSDTLLIIILLNIRSLTKHILDSVYDTQLVTDIIFLTETKL